MKMRMMVVLGGLFLVIACGEGNTEIVTRLHSLVDLQEATAEQCADGGTVVLTGVDTNENAELDPEEVTRSLVICDGADGTDGRTSLLRTDPEPAGEHCAEGGFKINHGVDDNGNGTLEEEEIDGFEYVCHGRPGLGMNSLVSIMDEAAGANCPSGGQAIRSGLDLNGDHLLQPAEVENTVYVCHGSDGATSLIRREDEPAGGNCPFGGQAVMTGVDGDGNGYLDDLEVQATHYVCHGADGAYGADGVNNLFETTVEPAGTTCPAGGVWVISGPDRDRDDFLDADEIEVEEVICHGVNGADGTDGVDGIDGSSNLLRATNAAWGGVCPFGGVKLETGVDLNANGVLDDPEVTQTQYVCNRRFSFTAIATGASHTCGILTGGTLLCWGYNATGQLGDESTTSRTTPVVVSGMGSGVAQIAASAVHTCAVKTNGSAWCWGYNVSGQLGDGTTTQRTTPVAVSGMGSGVAQIAAGYYHTCARKTDGSAWCWGFNGAGQLGDGTTTQRTTPVVVSGMGSRVRQIAAGDYHTCVVETDGSAWCWGNNNGGQLGDGTTTQRNTPVVVSGMGSGVAQIAAGSSHTCAIKTDGRVWCWGNNSGGQLGDGTNTSRTTPVAVSDMGSGVAQIAGGDYHTCEVKTDGSAWCWGYNENGQLGDGTITDRTTLVAVSGMGWGVAQIAGGARHTCAVKTDGSAWCWGYNVSGQLGDGSTIDRTTPVEVALGEMAP